MTDREPDSASTERSADSDGGRLDWLSRRRAIELGASLATAGAAAGCLGLSGTGNSVIGPQPGFASAVGNDSGDRWAYDPDGLRAEPMDTQVRSVGGAAVLFQYGWPVPSFDTWSGNATVRTHHSLDGRWRFRFDAADRGIEDGWYDPDFDDSGWETVRVPLPWDLYDTPSFGTYDGSNYGTGTASRNGYAWYRTRFSLDDTWDDRLVRLSLLGASYMAWVFVDGQLVAQHEGGQTPFSVPVKDALDQSGEHVLAVRVFRRRWWTDGTPVPLPVVDTSEIPGRPVDYWPYAGLTRSVYLEGTDPVTISKLLVDARDRTLSVRVVVENHGDEAAHRRLLVSPGEGTGGLRSSDRLSVAPGGVAIASLEFDVSSASPWSPTSPRTYRLTAELWSGPDGPDDALSTSYGLRTLSTDGSRLELNGAPVFLKGLNWHEETAARGRSLSPADFDDVVDRLDDLNANFVRNSHYTRHPYFYEAADDAGLLVMDEAPNTWMGGAQQRLQLDSYGLSRALVAAMVWNQHNHPSVGLWSLQNESDRWTGVYRDWLADMRSAATALDRQGRPVTWAAPWPRDPAYDLADVVGCNEYYGYFRGADADLGPALDALHDRHPDKPILVTENGTWSDPSLRGGVKNPPTRPGTPEWQAAQFTDHWRQVTAKKRRAYVAGYTYWILRDYKERDGYNQQRYNGVSTMGLLRFNGDVESAAYRRYRSAANPRPG